MKVLWKTCYICSHFSNFSLDQYKLHNHRVLGAVTMSPAKIQQGAEELGPSEHGPLNNKGDTASDWVSEATPPTFYPIRLVTSKSQGQPTFRWGDMVSSSRGLVEPADCPKQALLSCSLLLLCPVVHPQITLCAHVCVSRKTPPDLLPSVAHVDNDNFGMMGSGQPQPTGLVLRAP